MNRMSTISAHAGAGTNMFILVRGFFCGMGRATRLVGIVSLDHARFVKRRDAALLMRARFLDLGDDDSARAAFFENLALHAHMLARKGQQAIVLTLGGHLA